MESPSDNVRRLVERAQEGDRAAFGALVRKYQRRVFVTAFQIVHNSADADDLAQEAFIRAFRALHQFDFRSDFFTWLYRITVNTTLNFLKRPHRARTTYTDDAELLHHAIAKLMPGEADPRARVELRQLYRKVLEAIDALKPDLRVALTLHSIQGLSHREVAEAMECPEGTVAWRISEARRHLRAKLARHLRSRHASQDGLRPNEKEPFGLP